MSSKKPQQPIIPLTYGKDAASAAFGVSVPVIDSWIKRQDDPLPSFREGTRILIPVKEAQEWVSRQAKKAMEEINGTDTGRALHQGS